MYDRKIHATTDEQRFARPGEALFQHVHRVVEEWRANTSQSSLTMVDLPKAFKAEHPGVFGRFDDARLGTIVSLIWIYLAGSTGTVNERVIRKWFEDAIAAHKPGERR